MKSDARLALTVIGSGTLLPDAHRNSAAFHVHVAPASSGGGGSEARSAEDAGVHSLLLDAGSGALHGLARYGVEWRSIDTIAISHFHPDHVTDLPALLAAFRFEGLEAPLTLVGPPGLEDFLDRMAALHGEWIRSPSRPLEVVELEDDEVWEASDGSLRLEARPTPHTEESVAWRLSTGSSGPAITLGYTGDTGPSQEVARFLSGCSVLVAECSLRDPPELDTHLSPGTLAQLARGAAPDLLVVSHVYPPQSPDDAVTAVRKRYAGAVVAARDGMRVTVDHRGPTVDPSGDAP